MKKRTVKIPLPSLADAPAPLLVDLDDADLLERLDDVPVDGSGGVRVVAGAGAAVLLTAVDLPQAADADGLAEVDVACYGGYTYNVNFPSL